MLLDNYNAEKIAAHFKNKFQVVEYVGCWNNKTVTFAIWQNKNKDAGFELTINRPEGDHITNLSVKSVKRLQTYGYNAKEQRYKREYLPIYKA